MFVGLRQLRGHRWVGIHAVVRVHLYAAVIARSKFLLRKKQLREVDIKVMRLTVVFRVKGLRRIFHADPHNAAAKDRFNVSLVGAGPDGVLDAVFDVSESLHPLLAAPAAETSVAVTCGSPAPSKPFTPRDR
jgi:hypothetical protein